MEGTLICIRLVLFVVVLLFNSHSLSRDSGFGILAQSIKNSSKGFRT